VPGIPSVSCGTATNSGTVVDIVWTTWNVSYATSCSTSVSLTRNVSSLATGGAGVANQIWGIWTTATASGGTIGNTITLTSTWTNWNEQANAIADQRLAQQVVRQQAQRTQPSAEQLAAWREQERLRLERAEEAAREIVAARSRARKLLVACLTPEQRDDLEKKKCFYLDCHSRDGTKRRYRIDEGTHGNVKLLDDKGKVVGSYCVQPTGVPTEDAMLAQKLWLENDEEEFKRRANFRQWA